MIIVSTQFQSLMNSMTLSIWQWKNWQNPIINRICVWKSSLNSNDLRQSLKSLGKLTIRNGTLIIESLLRLQSLLIKNYEHPRQPRHTAIHSIQIVERIWLHGLTYRDGLPAFPRQLDWQGFRYDQNVWEGAKKCCESFIYLLVVVW